MVAAAEQAQQPKAQHAGVFADLKRTFSPNRVGGRSSASKERTAGGPDEGQLSILAGFLAFVSCHAISHKELISAVSGTRMADEISI